MGCFDKTRKQGRWLAFVTTFGIISQMPLQCIICCTPIPIPRFRNNHKPCSHDVNEKKFCFTKCGCDIGFPQATLKKCVIHVIVGRTLDVQTLLATFEPVMFWLAYTRFYGSNARFATDIFTCLAGKKCQWIELLANCGRQSKVFVKFLRLKQFTTGVCRFRQNFQTKVVEEARSCTSIY